MGNGGGKSKEPETPELLNVVWDGDVGEVRKMVEAAENVEDLRAIKDRAGWTAMHVACFKGNMEMIKYLVSSLGKDMVVTAKDKNGRAPAHLACYRGFSDIVIFFVDVLGVGPLITCGDGSNWTPLHEAAQENKYDIIGYFIDKGGANVILKCQDSNGITPLHEASSQGNFDVVAAILQVRKLYPEHTSQHRLVETRKRDCSKMFRQKWKYARTFCMQSGKWAGCPALL